MTASREKNHSVAELSSSDDAFYLASASIDDDGDAPIRGYIDYLGPDGIIGWASDLSNPDAKLSLELLVAGERVAICETGIYRKDLSTLMGREAFVGFQFASTDVAAMRHLAQYYASSRVEVRVTGTSYVLRSPEEAITVSAIVEQSPSGEEGTGISSKDNFSLLTHLSVLRSEADALLSKPLRPRGASKSGVIEAAAIDQAGCVWIIGWMTRQPQTGFSAIVVDRQKTMAGLAVTFFEREDLDASACGIVGCLLSDWRPSATSDLNLYIGEGEIYLSGVRPLRVILMEEFAANFSQVLDRCHTGYTGALQQMMRRPESWAVLRDRNGVPAQAAIDRILLLPSFGCLISGWALSPLKQIETFRLRFGNTILQCDRSSMYFKSRADLADVFPGSEALASKAGFVGVFPGQISEADLSNPVLKIIYADGTSSNHSVDPKVIRLLMHAVDPTSVLDLYPSISAEPFFSDFATSLRTYACEINTPVETYRRNICENTLVFVVPEDRSEAFLLFDQVSHYCRTNPRPAGLVFIASNTQLRPEIVALFDALDPETSQQASLFFMNDAAYAFYVLPAVLASVRARRFAFMAGGVFATEGGWASVLQTLRQANLPLTFFETGAHDAKNAPTESARFFAWSSIAFSAWVVSAPRYLGGFHEDNQLRTAGSAWVTMANAGRASRSWISSPFVSAVNQASTDPHTERFIK